MVHIPYSGGNPAHQDAAGRPGRVQVRQPRQRDGAKIKAGKLKALAVTTRRRSALPDLPTIAEAGLSRLRHHTWFGMLAPAGTPASIVAKLNGEIGKALHAPDVKDRMARMGAEPAPTTPEQFGALIQAELKKYAAMSRLRARKSIKFLPSRALLSIHELGIHCKPHRHRWIPALR